MRFDLLLALAVAIPGMAAAQAPRPDTMPASADKKPVKEKMICRPVASSTSRMAPKVCHTAAEWQALSRNDNGMDAIRRQ